MFYGYDSDSEKLQFGFYDNGSLFLYGYDEFTKQELYSNYYVEGYRYFYTVSSGAAAVSSEMVADSVDLKDTGQQAAQAETDAAHRSASSRGTIGAVVLSVMAILAVVLLVRQKSKNSNSDRSVMGDS